MGAQQREGPPGEVEGAPRALRGDGRRGRASTRKLDFDEILIPPGPRLGSIVLEAQEAREGLRRPRSSSTASASPCRRNGIVGIIGPNGVGKTTLFKTIVGLEPLDGGELKIGETVKITYVDQSRGGIDPNKTLWEVVSDGLDYHPGRQDRDPVARLRVASSASRGRTSRRRPACSPAASATASTSRSRSSRAATCCCSTSRPTTSTSRRSRSLENALLEFPGCAVVITHDRWFLDRIATHILAYEGTEEDPANWYWFEGNFEAYEENKIERLGPDAAKPHRSAYRKLTRGLTRDPPARPDPAPLERPRRVRARQQRRDAPPARGGAHLGVLASATTSGDAGRCDARCSTAGPGGDTLTLIARQEIEYLAPIPYLRAAARRAAVDRPHRRREPRGLLRGVLAAAAASRRCSTRGPRPRSCWSIRRRMRPRRITDGERERWGAVPRRTGGVHQALVRSSALRCAIDNGVRHTVTCGAWTISRAGTCRSCDGEPSCSPAC